MALLNKAAILGQTALKTEDVVVLEWGGEVRVRELTGAERDALEMSVAGGEQKDLRNMRARMVAMACVDADGKRLFSDADAKGLGELSAAALDRVFWVAMRLSGMSAADVQAAEENF